MRDPVLLMAVNGIPGLRWRERIAVVEAAGDAGSFARFTAGDVERLAGRALRNLSWDAGGLLSRAEGAVRCARARGVRIFSYRDGEYPLRLREIENPPFLLFARGELPVWNGSFLGIVGTRHPSAAGQRAARELGREAAERGIVVVSGLAEGIDAEAHAGALEGSGGTVAVLGNGADTVYPASNKRLAARILDAGGLLLTEFGPGEGVRKFHFPARNRIISGLSGAVVVTEAPEKSGSLITAAYAKEQGRRVFVDARALGGEGGGGTLRLAAAGAAVIASLDGVLALWDGGVPAGAGVNGGLKDGLNGRRGGGEIFSHGEGLFREGDAGGPGKDTAEGLHSGGLSAPGEALAALLERELAGGLPAARETI